MRGESGSEREGGTTALRVALQTPPDTEPLLLNGGGFDWVGVAPPRETQTTHRWRRDSMGHQAAARQCGRETQPHLFSEAGGTHRQQRQCRRKRDEKYNNNNRYEPVLERRACYLASPGETRLWPSVNELNQI